MTEDDYESMGIVTDENGDIGLVLMSPIGLFLFGSIAVCVIAVIAIPIILIAKVLS